ncbi:hypothetical protein IWQ61_006475 [Dispira simplex]|nr:hypothetical protein IWQ61_006475 [Dispira simplex]
MNALHRLLPSVQCSPTSRVSFRKLIHHQKLLFTPVRITGQAWFTTFRNKPVLSTLRSRTQTFMYHLPDGSSVSNPARPRLLRPILFTLGVGLVSYTVAAVYQVRREERNRTFWRSPLDFLSKPILIGRSANMPDMVKAETSKQEILQRQVDRVKRWSLLPAFIRRMYIHGVLKWLTASPGTRMSWMLIATHTVIFGLWQIRRSQLFMYRHFTHHPFSGKSYTLLTSCFSHRSFTHFTLNTLGVYYFVPPTADSMSKETFPAFYLTAGITAGLVSHVATNLFARSAMVLPGLGASGALYACFGAFTHFLPDARVSFIFLPMWDFTTQTAFYMAMLVDVVGLAMQNSTIAHGVHLAGALFGYFYSDWFPTLWERYKYQVASVVNPWLP